MPDEVDVPQENVGVVRVHKSRHVGFGEGTQFASIYLRELAGVKVP